MLGHWKWCLKLWKIAIIEVLTDSFGLVHLLFLTYLTSDSALPVYISWFSIMLEAASCSCFWCLSPDFYDASVFAVISKVKRHNKLVCVVNVSHTCLAVLHCTILDTDNFKWLRMDLIIMHHSATCMSISVLKVQSTILIKKVFSV